MFSKTEIFHRPNYHHNYELETLPSSFGRSSLKFHTNIQTTLRLFAIFGIDVMPLKKISRNRKLKMAIIVLYRWCTALLMCYSFAARLYKAIQPNISLMLSFSETVATASSVVLRFTILFNRTSILKVARSLAGLPVHASRISLASYARRQKIYFYFFLVGMVFIMCLSLKRAVAELITPRSFEVYRNAYMFSANINNHTSLFKIANGLVCVTHLLYIVQLYGVPALCLLLCCTVCRTVVFFLIDEESKVKDEVKTFSLKDVVNSLRKMHGLVRETERALSPMLFFLYGYLLSSLFFIVSLIIRKLITILIVLNI